jgi:hypothetical protein
MGKRFAAPVAFIVATTVLRLAYAADAPVDDGPARQIADLAVAKLKADDLTGMFSILTKKSVWPQGELAGTEEPLKKQRASLAPRYGKSLGAVEFVARETVGQSFVRYVYLERLERHAYVWRLTFYHGPKEWLVTEVNCDDKPQYLFKAAP